MAIAVVGGGIFGCTAAIEAARQGYEVDLYEEKKSLLNGATASNQYRLHEGYHYPRSPETAIQCQKGNVSFREEYAPAIVDNGEQYYAIAVGSKVSAHEYLEFCEKCNLEYEVVSAGELINPDNVELVIRVREGRIDMDRLRRLCNEKLADAVVNVRYQPFTPYLGYKYDRVIVATYANINPVIAGVPAYNQCKMDQFQFELVEKPIVRTARLINKGIVVMDGEFGCIDPMGDNEDTLYSVVGHVKHAIWSRNIGLEAMVPYALVPYIDRGVVFNAARTKWMDIRDSLIPYLPVLEHADYWGSMWTVRAVLPNKDKTDERPTLVEYLEKDRRYIRIFSGKIGTAVDAAKQAVSML